MPYISCFDVFTFRVLQFIIKLLVDFIFFMSIVTLSLWSKLQTSVSHFENHVCAGNQNLRLYNCRFQPSKEIASNRNTSFLSRSFCAHFCQLTNTICQLTCMVFVLVVGGCHGNCNNFYFSDICRFSLLLR